jgi:hypothetical protein
MMSRMDNGGGRRRRVLLAVVGGLVLVIIAGVVAYLVLRDEHDEDLARDTIGQVEAPGPDWDAVRELADQSGERAQYVVSWHLRLQDGDDEAVCDEVAAWLADTTEAFPGEAAPEDDRDPGVDPARKSCLKAIDPRPEGAGSVAFSPWPGTEAGGYLFGTGLILKYDGEGRRDLSARAEAKATP